MGNKNPKEIKKSDYENFCSKFNDYFIKEKNNLENIKKEIDKKIEEKEEKTIIFNLIKNLLEKEKKEKILNKFQEIFVNLFDKYEKIHRKEEENIKKISDDNKKNIINVIYISKIFEKEIEDFKIHDYAVYLFGEDVVKEIENGNDKNIDEDFKKYFDDKIEIKQEEIEEKFNEICKSKNIDPKNYENNNESNNNNNESNNKIFDNNNQKNINSQKKYNNDNLFQFYDIIFDIESFEKLKKKRMGN